MSFHKESFDRKFYYCKKKHALDCQARVSIEEKAGMIFKWMPEHCHDLAVQKIKEMVSKEVEEATKNPLVNPRTVHQKMSAFLAFLPTMAKKIQYERRKTLKLPPVPKDWNFTISPEFRNTVDSLKFIL